MPWQWNNYCQETVETVFPWRLKSRRTAMCTALLELLRGWAYSDLRVINPIFWMHHANIDRIWESWRRANQTGLLPLDTVANADADAKENWDKFDKFAFVDANAALAMASVDDAIKAAAKLGTAYDKLDDVPGEPGAPAMMSFAQADPPTTLSAKKPTPQPTQITKEDAPVKVSVAPAVAPPVALRVRRQGKHTVRARYRCPGARPARCGVPGLYQGSEGPWQSGKGGRAGQDVQSVHALRPWRRPYRGDVAS